MCIELALSKIAFSDVSSELAARVAYSLPVCGFAGTLFCPAAIRPSVGDASFVPIGDEAFQFEAIPMRSPAFHRPSSRLKAE